MAFGGVATFNNVSITAAGNYVITARATYLGDTRAVSGNIAVTNPAAVPSLTYLTPPAASVAADTVLPSVVVEVLLNGTRDVNDNSSVSLEVGNVTIATATAVQGVATFSGLEFTTPGNFLMVAYDGTYGTASAGFTVTPPVVTTALVLIITVPPALPTDWITNDALDGVWNAVSPEDNLLFHARGTAIVGGEQTRSGDRTVQHAFWRIMGNTSGRQSKFFS